MEVSGYRQLFGCQNILLFRASYRFRTTGGRVNDDRVPLTHILFTSLAILLKHWAFWLHYATIVNGY